MNVRQAILNAADHIEQRPRDFDFMRCAVPADCGTPGCALGWIGHFLGMGGADFKDVNARLGLETDELMGARQFYDRMDALNNANPGEMEWTDSSRICAKVLRLYADAHHPESRALIPESVRRIFTASPAELSALLQD